MLGELRHRDVLENEAAVHDADAGALIDPRGFQLCRCRRGGGELVNRDASCIAVQAKAEAIRKQSLHHLFKLALRS